MAILTHGTDLSLAPTLGPLVRDAGLLAKAALRQVSRAGFTRVQLDATLPGLRPRDLDQRARRDLAALLARQNLAPSGIDLFIPRRHFAEPRHTDRATAAALGAIALAAELGRLPVSLALPVGRLPEDVQHALLQAADGHGIDLAIHAEGELDRLITWLDRMGLPGVGASVDPAALLALGHDPAQVVHRLGPRLRVARLADAELAEPEPAEDRADSDDAGADDRDEAGRESRPASRLIHAHRQPVGRGDLDVMSYRVAVDLAQRCPGPVVLDLRELRGSADDPLAPARAGRSAWEDQAVNLG